MSGFFVFFDKLYAVFETDLQFGKTSLKNTFNVYYDDPFTTIFNIQENFSFNSQDILEFEFERTEKEAMVRLKSDLIGLVMYSDMFPGEIIIKIKEDCSILYIYKIGRKDVKYVLWLNHKLDYRDALKTYFF